MAKPTHEVVHPKFRLMHNGKMTRMPVGAQITLTDEDALRYGAKVCEIGSKPVMDVGGESAKEMSAADRKRIKKLTDSGLSREVVDAGLAISVTTMSMAKALNAGATAEAIAEAIKAGNDPETGLPVSS